MKIIFLYLSFLIGGTVFAQSNVNISLDTPPEKLSILGAGSISTFLNERDFALSPDGHEFYYTVTTPKSSVQTIVYCKKIKDGEWSVPEVVPFAGEYSDLEPAFSQDGKTLYFASNRPVNGDRIKDFDIWRVTRVGNNWGKPENLGATINSNSDEFYPSVSKNGNIYFTASYPNGIGKEDIFVSYLSGNTFQKPIALDTAVNSALYEFNAFVSPNEDYILFTSFGRKDDSGRGDLYISFKDTQNKWMKAVNVKQINSPFLDYCPYVTPDGKTLILTSERNQLPSSYHPRATYQKIIETSMNPLNGSGNLYWLDFQKLIASLK